MITLLIGLPGSGKTWYAQNVLEYDHFVDDPMHPSDFALDIAPTDHLVIADPKLCIAHERAVKSITRMFPEHSIETIFFENDAEKCKKNIAYRTKNGDERKVSITFDFLASQYTIPKDVKIIPIWSPENVEND